MWFCIQIRNDASLRLYRHRITLRAFTEINFKKDVHSGASNSLLDTSLCDKVCQCLAACRWFSPGPLVSSTNKTDRHDIVDILLKVALNTI